MSLLKVSLCIGLNKDYCTWTHAWGAEVSARPPPGRTKTFFFAVWGAFLLLFSMGRALCYVYLLMGGFFHCMDGLFATFSLRGGPFCYVFFLVWDLFHNVGAFFAIFFSLWRDFFVFMFFLMGLPLPSMIYFAAHAIM